MLTPSVRALSSPRGFRKFFRPPPTRHFRESERGGGNSHVNRVEERHQDEEVAEHGLSYGRSNAFNTDIHRTANLFSVVLSKGLRKAKGFHWVQLPQVEPNNTQKYTFDQKTRVLIMRACILFEIHGRSDYLESVQGSSLIPILKLMSD